MIEEEEFMYVEDTCIKEARKYAPNWDHLYEIVNSFVSNIVQERIKLTSI